MKNIRVKVRERCIGDWFDYGIYKGRKILMRNVGAGWVRKSAATRNAKAMAKRIGIPFDNEIVKQHGC